jgi:tetratricopeptide (TPR) repeat protein
MGRIEAALATWTRALGPASARMNLGFALAAQGRIDEARAHYREALRLQPNLAEARQALAKLDRPQGAAGPSALAAGTQAPSAEPARRDRDRGVRATSQRTRFNAGASGIR